MKELPAAIRMISQERMWPVENENSESLAETLKNESEGDRDGAGLGSRERKREQEGRMAMVGLEDKG